MPNSSLPRPALVRPLLWMPAAPTLAQRRLHKVGLPVALGLQSAPLGEGAVLGAAGIHSSGLTGAGLGRLELGIGGGGAPGGGGTLLLGGSAGEHVLELLATFHGGTSTRLGVSVGGLDGRALLHSPHLDLPGLGRDGSPLPLVGQCRSRV